MVSSDIFHKIIEHAPLFAIDLVIVNERSELLVGKRLNAPAKGSWFVPGGRVFKGECLADAFARISKNELGVSLDIQNAILLGLFDHIYEDSVFSKDVGTHYINAAHFLQLRISDLNLPVGDQHLSYRWINLCDVEADASVHKYSKVFLPSLFRLNWPLYFSEPRL